MRCPALLLRAMVTESPSACGCRGQPPGTAHIVEAFASGFVVTMGVIALLLLIMGLAHNLSQRHGASYRPRREIDHLVPGLLGSARRTPGTLVGLYPCHGETGMVRSAAQGDPTVALV